MMPSPIGRIIPVILIQIALLGTACRQNKEMAPAEARKTDSFPAFKLLPGPIEKQFILPADLIAYERTEIFAKLGGYAEKIFVDIGDAVRKDQILAQIQAPELEASHAQAAAEVQALLAKWTASTDAYRRFQQADKQQGTVAAIELERIKNQFLTDSSNTESARAKLLAQRRLMEYLVIRAPFDGQVTQRNIDPGALVGPANPKPLLVIENNRKLRLRVPVPEALVSAVPGSQGISFTVDALPGRTFEARLSRKAGALNMVNRTETWEFLCENKENLLKSGMFARASFPFKRPDPGFVVPAAAVFTSNEKRFVIRVNSKLAEWIDVRLGTALDRGTEIFGPLQAGDTLLMRATDEIKPGTALFIKF